jgi:hypothetical protein
MKVVAVLMIGFMLLVIACSKSNDSSNYIVDCSAGAKSYATDVSPLIQTYCAGNSGCHASGSINGPGPLTTYQQVYTSRAAIRSAVASGYMPQDKTLSAAQKNTIVCWIDDGATDN